VRWIPFFHLWLCALLSLQQPSVLVQTGARLQGVPVGEVQDGPAAGPVEETELPGLNSGTRPRFKATAPRRWRTQRVRPVLPASQAATAPAPHGGSPALAHWRAAQLPPRVPPEDEQRTRG